MKRLPVFSQSHTLAVAFFEDMSNKQRTYALYKGDTLLSIGTVKELAKEFGVHEETIAYYASPTYRKRTSAQKGRRLIKIEDDE